jgi:hypothetical protein
MGYYISFLWWNRFCRVEKNILIHQIYIQMIISGPGDAKQKSPTFILLFFDSDNLNIYGYEQTITDACKNTK